MKLLAISAVVCAAVAAAEEPKGYDAPSDKGYDAPSDYSEPAKKGYSKCRKVEQERPVCAKYSHTVKEDFTFKGTKQNCRFVKVEVKDHMRVEVKGDSCKSKIATKKNKRPVHINNKVCEYEKGYGEKDEKKKPVCRIEKETKYVYSYDKVTKWDCSTQSDYKTIPVKFHVSKEVCDEYPVKEKKYVSADVTEKRCHVEKYYREICDDDKGGQYYKDGGDENYQPEYNKGYGGYGETSKKSSDDGYKVSYGDSGYGNSKSKDNYGSGYGNSKPKDNYGSDYGNSKPKDNYGDRYGGRYASKPKDSYRSKGYGMDDYGYASKPKDNYGSGYGNSKPKDNYGGRYGNSKPRDNYGDSYGYASKPKDSYKSKGYGMDDYGYASKPKDNYGYNSKPKDNYGDGYGVDYGNSKPKDNYGSGYGNSKPKDNYGSGYGNSKPKDNYGDGYGDNYGNSKPKDNYGDSYKYNPSDTYDITSKPVNSDYGSGYGVDYGNSKPKDSYTDATPQYY